VTASDQPTLEDQHATTNQQPGDDRPRRDGSAAEARRRRPESRCARQHLWDEAARHYDESELAGLVVAIAAINAWNRINAATRQITGEWVDQWVSRTDPAASQAA